MNITDIGIRIKIIIDQMKRSGTPYLNDGKKTPEFNPVYRECVYLKNRIEVHTELDKKPYEMMNKRAPYEDDRQYDYRKENWNNITMPYWQKAVGVLSRIWNQSNYSINWGKEQVDEKEYFESGIPLFRSIESYFEQIPTVIKITDPNAILLVKPYFLPVKEVDTEMGKELVYDQTALMPAIPITVGCEDVLDYMEGMHAIILSKEKSIVIDGKKEVKEGLIFEIYDQNTIYQVKQIGKKQDWRFTEPEIYYEHNLGYLPCQKLKGIPKQKGVNVYYQSPFTMALPNLDIALYLHSNLDLSIVNHLNPQRSEIVDKCDQPDCVKGFIYFETDEGKRMHEKCPKCNGAGTISNIGPMMVKQIQTPPSFGNELNQQNVTGPGIWYTAPPHEPLEFVDKKIDSLIVGGFAFVNIDVSNSNVKGSDVALSKQIDREELFAFILKFSNEMFELLDWTMQTIGRMRFGVGFQTPAIAPPTSFEIRSEADLTEELTEAKKNGTPEIFTKEILKQLMNKRFSSQVIVEKAANLIFAVDRLVTCNNTEVQGMVAAGAAENWEYILHASASSFLEEILIQDPDFFNKDYEQQKQLLIEKAKSVAESIAASKNNTKSIVDMANAGAA